MAKFSVEKIRNPQGKQVKAIRFGLEALKGVGGIAVEAIIDARKPENGGPFKSILDFARRVSSRKVNKKVMEYFNKKYVDKKPEDMPFDMKRMAYGGFSVVVS